MWSNDVEEAIETVLRNDVGKDKQFEFSTLRCNQTMVISSMSIKNVVLIIFLIDKMLMM
jgi:hypothetical protein